MTYNGTYTREVLANAFDEEDIKVTTAGATIVFNYNPELHARVSLKDVCGEIESYAKKLLRS